MLPYSVILLSAVTRVDILVICLPRVCPSLPASALWPGPGGHEGFGALSAASTSSLLAIFPLFLCFFKDAQCDRRISLALPSVPVVSVLERCSGASTGAAQG